MQEKFYARLSFFMRFFEVDLIHRGRNATIPRQSKLTSKIECAGELWVRSWHFGMQSARRMTEL